MTDPKDIPVVILCGGMGTRLREASERLPKPLVDIGGRPILWHVMKTYSQYGFRRFVLCLGYKSDLIKQYFLNYRTLTADFTIDLADDAPARVHTPPCEEWTITFAETGLTTATGARVHRIRDYLDADRFALTYGDGIGDIRLDRLLATHESSGKIGTVTGVHPSSRYGEMHVSGESVTEFNEKPTLASGWVNGGFFLFEREFADHYLSDDPDEMLEHRPLQKLARDDGLGVFEHNGFWMGMDTFRDWTELNRRWDTGDAPWRVWDDTPVAAG